MLTLVIGVAGFLAAGSHIPAHAGCAAAGGFVPTVHQLAVHHSTIHRSMQSPGTHPTDMGATTVTGHPAPADHDTAKDLHMAHICFFCMTLEGSAEFIPSAVKISWPLANAVSSFQPATSPFHPPRLS